MGTELGPQGRGCVPARNKRTGTGDKRRKDVVTWANFHPPVTEGQSPRQSANGVTTLTQHGRQGTMEALCLKYQSATRDVWPMAEEPATAPEPHPRGPATGLPGQMGGQPGSLRTHQDGGRRKSPLVLPTAGLGVTGNPTSLPPWGLSRDAPQWTPQNPAVGSRPKGAAPRGFCRGWGRCRGPVSKGTTQGLVREGPCIPRSLWSLSCRAYPKQDPSAGLSTAVALGPRLHGGSPGCSHAGGGHGGVCLPRRDIEVRRRGSGPGRYV